MKKWLSALLCLAVLLVLTACRQQSPVVTVGAYTVDTENRTISDGQYTYSYICYGVGTQYSMSYANTVFYPNGAEYTERFSEKNGVLSEKSVEITGDYDDQRYTSGETLLQIVKQANQVVQEQKGPDVNWSYLIGGVILIAAGVLGLIFPEQTWYIAHYFKRWQYQNLDPTEEGLMMAKVGDTVSILIGVVLVICSFA